MATLVLFAFEAQSLGTANLGSFINLASLLDKINEHQLLKPVKKALLQNLFPIQPPHNNKV